MCVCVRERRGGDVWEQGLAGNVDALPMIYVKRFTRAKRRSRKDTLSQRHTLARTYILSHTHTTTPFLRSQASVFVTQQLQQVEAENETKTNYNKKLNKREKFLRRTDGEILLKKW